MADIATTEPVAFTDSDKHDLIMELMDTVESHIKECE